MEAPADQSVPPGPEPVPRRVALPPAPYDRVKVFGGLLLVLLACVPVMFVSLGQGDVTQRREAEALRASRETLSRQQADETGKAWLLPTLNGEVRYDPPPMSVWLHLLAWWDLDAAASSPGLLILRARLLAVAMGTLTLLATYWAGMSVGDARVARLATLALGTTLLFVYQARTASSDTHMLAFCTTAVAAGLWAMRPLKEINWAGRRIVGWLVAGLALGAAILTQGVKPAALFVLPPLLAAIALTPRRRIDNLLGLSFAAMLGVVAASPWYLYALQQNPDTLHLLFGDAIPPRELFVITPSHWRVLAVLSPWLVWVIGALCQPFIRADHERRRQLLIAWFWFGLLFVILSIPAADSPRYLSPLLPAAALLVGQLWAFHAQLASERQVDPGVDLLRVPHWASLLLASVLGPALVVFQPRLVGYGLIDEPLLPGVGWASAAAMGAVLLLIASLGTRWHFKWKPRLAAYATAAWMVAALIVCLPAFARSEENTLPHRQDAQRFAEAGGDRPLFYLVLPHRDEPLDHRFLFYAGRVVRPLTANQAAEAVGRDPRVGIVVTLDERQQQRMSELGLDLALRFDDGDEERALYVRDPARQTPKSAE